MSYISHKKPPSKLAIVSILFVVVLGVGGWLYWQNSRQAGEDGLVVDANPEIASPQEIESGYASSLAGFLEAEEYDNYQISARSIARHYYSTQDYASAERVMQEVVAKVPAERVETASLLMLADIYKAAGNTGKYDEYQAKAVASLRAAGLNTEADTLSNPGDQ